MLCRFFIALSASIFCVALLFTPSVQAEDVTVTAELPSPMPQYEPLRQQLAIYRQLAEAHPGPLNLPPLPGKKLQSGDVWEWAGATLLAERLMLLGDMPAGSWATVDAVYRGALVEGVQHFQLRHGLLADGVIGAKTYEALRTPLEQRVQQIERSMERLRALSVETVPVETLSVEKSAVENPHVDTQQPFILINIPQFTLWAYAPGRAPLKMAVVVGNAAKSQTPIFSAEMSHVIFNPYWNVPRSIAVKELLPKIDKNPGYLLGEDMELVAKDGSIYNGAVTREQRNGIVLGDYRIRQRPGEKNALGNIKFMFPNNDSIYMHDTPGKKLFARERRDFSHGCIRLSNPLGMALYALAQNGRDSGGDWDEASINTQIATGTEKHLRLQQQIPVLITYLTANVDEEGRVVFAPDIYGLDAVN